MGEKEGSISHIFLGMFAVSDPEGIYIQRAVAFTEAAEEDISVLVADAAKRVVVEEYQEVVRLLKIGSDSDREEWRLTHGKAYSPSFIWMQPTGYEDSVIKGFQEVFGMNVVILGGSAADTSFSGRQRVYAHGSSVRPPSMTDDGQDTRSVGLASGVSFCIAWSSVETITSFSSGFTETGLSGRVTELGKDGKNVVSKIDGVSAGILYDRWTNGILSRKVGLDGHSSQFARFRASQLRDSQSQPSSFSGALGVVWRRRCTI